MKLFKIISDEEVKTGDLLISTSDGRLFFARDNSINSEEFPTQPTQIKTTRSYKARASRSTDDVVNSSVKKIVIDSKRWARDFDCCIVCGTTETKYGSLGMCKNCYQKHNREEKLNDKPKLTGRKNLTGTNKYKCIDCDREFMYSEPLDSDNLNCPQQNCFGHLIQI